MAFRKPRVDKPLRRVLNLRVPYPSRFSRGGWFLIEFSYSVDEIDVDQSFGHRTEKAPNSDPSKPPKGRPPALLFSHTLRSKWFVMGSLPHSKAQRIFTSGCAQSSTNRGVNEWSAFLHSALQKWKLSPAY